MICILNLLLTYLRGASFSSIHAASFCLCRCCMESAKSMIWHNDSGTHELSSRWSFAISSPTNVTITCKGGPRSIRLAPPWASPRVHGRRVQLRRWICQVAMRTYITQVLFSRLASHGRRRRALHQGIVKQEKDESCSRSHNGHQPPPDPREGKWTRLAEECFSSSFCRTPR